MARQEISLILDNLESLAGDFPFLYPPVSGRLPVPVYFPFQLFPREILVAAGIIPVPGFPVHREQAVVCLPSSEAYPAEYPRACRAAPWKAAGEFLVSLDEVLVHFGGLALDVIEGENLVRLLGETSRVNRAIRSLARNRDPEKLSYRELSSLFFAAAVVPPVIAAPLIEEISSRAACPVQNRVPVFLSGWGDTPVEAGEFAETMGAKIIDDEGWVSARLFDDACSPSSADIRGDMAEAWNFRSGNPWEYDPGRRYERLFSRLKSIPCEAVLLTGSEDVKVSDEIAALRPRLMSIGLDPVVWRGSDPGELAGYLDMVRAELSGVHRQD